MSADNYLYVGKTDDGRYGYEMRFASHDYPEVIDAETAEPKFATVDEAVRAARGENMRGMYEYGVQIHPEVYSEWVAA